jgi:hypothetical protein
MSEYIIEKALEKNLELIEKFNEEYREEEKKLNELKKDFEEAIRLEKDSKTEMDKQLNYDEKIAIAKKMVKIGQNQEKIINKKQSILDLIESEILPSPVSSPFDLSSESFGGRRKHRRTKRSKNRKRSSRRKR